MQWIHAVSLSTISIYHEVPSKTHSAARAPPPNFSPKPRSQVVLHKLSTDVAEYSKMPTAVFGTQSGKYAWGFCANFALVQVLNDQVLNDQVLNDQVLNDQVLNDQVLKFSMIKFSMIKFSMIKFSMIKFSMIKFSMIKFSMIKFSMIKFSMIKFSMIKFSMIKFSMIKFSMIKFSMIKFSMIKFSMIKFSMIKFSMIKFSMIKFSMIKFSMIKKLETVWWVSNDLRVPIYMEFRIKVPKWKRHDFGWTYRLAACQAFQFLQWI